MQYEEHAFAYPPVHPGTDRTFIRFYSGTPDLDSIFFTGDSSDCPMRIFVTDTNVSSLPCTEKFFSRFSKCKISDSSMKTESVGTCGSDVLVVLGSGETFKTIESVLSIISAALNLNAQRSSVFIGIGGGVICDMTAFAASIFKRGAHCELVPTTLLAMVDASIGGKTGCDFSSYKNMIGTFFPAQKIHVCPEFAQFLSSDQYRSGLAEAVKTALLYSPKLFEKLESNIDSVKKRDGKIINEMISVCIRAKAEVVEKDLTEQNIRMQLNFGHTFGHALESCAGLGIVSHGDAVAWGISRALALSEKLNLCTHEYKNRVAKVLSSYGWETGAIHSAIAKKSSREESARALYSAMKKDKKNNSSRVRFILQRHIGDTVIAEADEKDVMSVLTED